MRVLKILANANAFMSVDYRFYKTKVVDEFIEGQIDAQGNPLKQKRTLVHPILPKYKNRFLEIYEVERVLFSPYYFAVKLNTDGRRELLEDVFEKTLFPYKIKLLGVTDFAVAWIGETKKTVAADGSVSFEDIQNGVAENWSVFALSGERIYRNISAKLGGAGDVFISALDYDDGILSISLCNKRSGADERNRLFIREEDSYRRIGEAEYLEYWSDVAKEQIATSNWMPAAQMIDNSADFPSLL